MPECKKTIVKKVVTIEEEGYELKIDKEDAAVLLEIFDRIGGPIEVGEPHERCDKMRSALREAGVERKFFKMDEHCGKAIYFDK